MEDNANNIIKYGEIQLIDYVMLYDQKCKCCGEDAAYTVFIGNITLHLCYECLGNLGHCIIDGLL